MNRSLNLGRLDLAALSMVPKVIMTFCLGAMTALAMPPFDLWWVLGITFPALLILIENSKPAKAFGLAWLFAFGYFIAVLHWIGFAFLVNAEADLWMMPFAVGGLSAVMALYWGVAAWFTKILTNRGLHIFFAAPFCISITEFLRGRLFSGFPWAVPGQAVDGMRGVSQVANLIGMNGLTLMILLWAAMPLAFLRGQRAIAISVLALLPAIWMWGEWRLAQNPTQFMADVNLRIVQPNFSQDDKWRGDNARKIFDDLLAQSDAPSQNGRPITHIIWPESVVPFLIDESPEGLKEVGQMLGDHKILLAGAVRRSQPDNKADYFTSVLVIDGQARVLSHYDKSHLVPGGEYLPLAWALEPLGFRRVVNLPESFKAGSGAESMLIPGAGLVGAQICYEAIFPEQAVDSLLTHCSPCTQAPRPTRAEHTSAHNLNGMLVIELT